MWTNFNFNFIMPTFLRYPPLLAGIFCVNRFIFLLKLAMKFRIPFDLLLFLMWS